MATQQDLLDLEQAGWEALSSTPEDAARFYGDVLAPQVLMLLPGGMVIDDRQHAIDSMSGTPWDRFELGQERVHDLGEGCAAVAYRATASRGGQDYTALCTSTYVRSDGRWRLALHQQTPV